jgi:hypothetical protein
MVSSEEYGKTNLISTPDSPLLATDSCLLTPGLLTPGLLTTDLLTPDSSPPTPYYRLPLK